MAGVVLGNAVVTVQEMARRIVYLELHRSLAEVYIKSLEDELAALHLAYEAASPHPYP